MNLSDAIKAYHADRRARGIAPGTTTHERTTLNHLLNDVGNLHVHSLRVQHIDRFWANRTTWSPGTMNRGRHTLVSFFTWCQARGYMKRDLDLMAGQRKLRVPPRSRVIIPQDEFSSLLGGIKDHRLRAFTAIGLYSFARISEIADLRWQNRTGENLEVYREKTKTLDVLPVCMELEDELDRWRFHYAALARAAVQPAWFIIPGLTPILRRGVPGKKGFQIAEKPRLVPTQRCIPGWMVTKVLKDAGYYQPYEGGHTLRRSGAVALYDQLTHVGHDRAIRICQAMLGHSSIQTTEIYLRLDLDRKVRNDLLAGQPMFPKSNDAPVVSLERRTGG